MSTLYRPSEHTPAEWRAMAAVARRRSQESFDRCDTDGFMSQHANDLFADLYERCAQIADGDGCVEFDALLYIDDGSPVDARIIDTRFGCKWIFTRRDGVVAFVSPGARPATFAKHGVRCDVVRRPAAVRIGGRGRGFSGTTWVETIPDPQGGAR